MSMSKCQASDPATCKYHGVKNMLNDDDNIKVCSTCKQEKSIDEFGINKSKKDGLQGSCKPCRVISNKKYYISTPELNDLRKSFDTRRKEIVNSIVLDSKNKGCVDCGLHVVDAMEFDHTSDNKFAEISSIHKEKVSDEELKQLVHAELMKGDMCCGNCHRIRTIKRYANSKRLMFLENPNHKKLNDKEKYVYNHLQKSGCIDCGNQNFLVLESDHVKGAKVAGLPVICHQSQYTLEDVKIELSKCETRCVNCHKIKTLARARKQESTEQIKLERKINSTVCSCGNTKSPKALNCLSCSNKNKTKTNYPPKDELLKMIKLTSWEQVARELNVSSNAIRKFLKKDLT